MKTKVELSEKDIETAVAYWLKHDRNMDPVSVYLRGEMEWRGHGMQEQAVPVVKCTATVGE